MRRDSEYENRTHQRSDPHPALRRAAPDGSLNLRRAGGVWELETVSAPFIKHSHKINLIHPQVSGEVEVSKVVSKTNDSGFIRTYIYF